MRDLVLDKPYKFVPPYRGSWWPSLIQFFRLHEFYLRKNGVHSHEVRHIERLKESIAAGHGILLCPNHCRVVDPVVMGYVSREAKQHVYAMAAWYLFNEGWFQAFAIRRMGGFSVNREGIDRQAVSTAIDILCEAKRSLVIFPEGAVTRNNDRLHSFLDGVSFIARSAAKKCEKLNPPRKVVVHPVALRYLLKDDLEKAVGPTLTEIEHRLTWRSRESVPLIDRVISVGKALLSLKELEYFGEVRVGPLSERQPALVEFLLGRLEKEWFGAVQKGGVVPRVKGLRTKITPEMILGTLSKEEYARRYRQLEDLYLAQQVSCYPSDYLAENPSVDRLLEIVERYIEDLTDRPHALGRMHVICDVGEAIEVPLGRDRNAEVDQLMEELRTKLQSMLDELAKESRPYQPRTPSAAPKPPAESTPSLTPTHVHT
jgi:1-acyl-sn-glycerol-3-phosphate acyltransferase